DVITRLHHTRGVTKIGNPYTEVNGGRISDDQRSAMLTFEIPGDYTTDKKTETALDASIDAVKAAAEAQPNVRIEQFGDGSSEGGFQDLIQSDLQKAETLSLPFTIVVLLLTFGTLLAAGIPVLLALTGVLATFGLIGPISQISPVEESIKNVV